jgi:DNA-directed RNA polymerase specialized sigma24 family protein
MGMEDFVEFATAAAPRLRQTAFLLCGDWHTAEDLAQTTLTKMFVSWRRIKQREAAFSYASRTLVNTYVASRRGRRARSSPRRMTLAPRSRPTRVRVP